MLSRKCKVFCKKVVYIVARTQNVVYKIRTPHSVGISRRGMPRRVPIYLKKRGKATVPVRASGLVYKKQTLFCRKGTETTCTTSHKYHNPLIGKNNKDIGGTAETATFYLPDVSLAHPDLILLRVKDLPGLVALHFALAHEAGDFRFGGTILVLPGFLRLGRFIEHGKPPPGICANRVPTAGDFGKQVIPSNFVKI